MSEYVTLASNVKTVPSFGKNTIAEFRTKLGRIVSLEGDWVVGLSEITYSKSWYTVLYSHKVLFSMKWGTLTVLHLIMTSTLILITEKMNYILRLVTMKHP